MEPYRTPAWTGKGSDSCPWTTSVVVRSVMKAWTHRTSQPGILFLRRVSKSRVGFTVSKAPEMSRESSEATCFFDVHTVRTCSTSSSKAVSVDLPGVSYTTVSAMSFALVITSSIPQILGRCITYVQHSSLEECRKRYALLMLCRREIHYRDDPKSSRLVFAAS